MTKYRLHQIVTSAKEKIKIGKGEYEGSCRIIVLERVAREALVEKLTFA